MDKELIHIINKDLVVDWQEQTGMEELRSKLAAYINHLIQKDFHALISLLYRIDINESKIKTLLEQQQGSDAGLLIADAIIERQLQKLKSRKETRKDNTDTDEEKW